MGGGSKVLLLISKELLKTNKCFLIVQEGCVLSEEFKSMGGDVFIIKLPAWRKFRNFIKKWRTVKDIINLINQKEINLVICNSYRVNPYALYPCIKTKIPFLTYIHDRVKNKHFNNFLLNKIPNIVVPSFYVKSFLEKQEKIKVIHNGIEVNPKSANSLDLRSLLGLKQDSFIVGMVAHFTKNKRHALIIDMAGKLRSLDASVKVVFVGADIYNSGISIESLKKRAIEKGSQKNIHFLGNRSDVEAIIKNFDIFIFPCLYESFGFSALEAMRQGKPLLVDKDSGGTLELLENNSSGEIVDFTDLDKTAERIVFLKNNPELLKRYGKRGRELFLEKFTYERFIKETLDYYFSVINSSREKIDR